MTAPVVDLPRIAAALRRLDVHVSEHPHLTGDAARERCAAWLEGEEPDEHAVEPDTVAGEEPDAAPRPARAGRRDERPASRGD